MKKSLKTPAQQGGPDGLCGIYSLLNFISSKIDLAKKDDPDREAFRVLLASAEQLNLLTAHRLYDGFEWHHLMDIFNLTARNLRIDYYAISLSALAFEPDVHDFEKIKAICDLKGAAGAAIVHMNLKDYWVLVYQSDGDNITIADSSEATKSYEIDRLTNRNKFRITCDVGLALLPIGPIHP